MRLKWKFPNESWRYAGQEGRLLMRAVSKVYEAAAYEFGFRLRSGSGLGSEFGFGLGLGLGLGFG